METTYSFYERNNISGGLKPFRYTQLHKAIEHRDAIIKAGGSPTTIWPVSKCPKRPLRLPDDITVSQVLDRLNKVLAREKLTDDGGFGCSMDWKQRGWSETTTWMSLQSRVACYAVTGGSEGHYIHVDLVTPEPRVGLFLVKTFAGMDAALKISNRTTELLGA